ncbi:MAG: selenium cofactor biosynthesis protein YqeC [Dehalococcoidia bacterium]|nr:selenium cofactor biosynthesis protein YqeC [Dehalococcoidia bacterium]
MAHTGETGAVRPGASGPSGAPGLPATPLWDALALGDPAPGVPVVVAIVGGGGKTTLLYRLGQEAVARGLRAVVTGTTRFTRLEPMPPLLRGPQEGAPEAIARHWAALDDAEGGWVAVAGDRDQPAGRLDPLEVETVARVAALPGVGLVAVEADGSKMRPFKAPSEDEPVIPDCATHVVVVVGADALDAPLDEGHVHRPERVREILGQNRIRSVEDGATCDADLIAAVLAHAEGGRKGVGDRTFAALVNKADIDLDSAVRLARAVHRAGVPRVVIAALREETTPVREVIT